MHEINLFRKTILISWKTDTNENHVHVCESNTATTHGMEINHILWVTTCVNIERCMSIHGDVNMCRMLVNDVQKKSDGCLVWLWTNLSKPSCHNCSIVLAPLVTHVWEMIHRSTSMICACIIYVWEMAAE